MAFSKCYDAISSIGTTKSFADIHDETILDDIVAMEDDQADQHEGQEKEAQDIPCLKRRVSCKRCIPCAFQTLYLYNLHVATFSTLYVAYKCVMMLSCTQVSCERLFSKLSIVKNRLRSTLGQPHLESLLILSTEERNFPIIHEQIIDKFASSSKLLKKLLIV